MINMSFSSISDFKSCPMRHYYRDVLKIVPIEDSEAQRMGTNWHAIQEVAASLPVGTSNDDIMDAVIEHLNKVYSVPPISKTTEEWEVERIILLYSLIGYRWYYQDDTYEVESLEQKFNLPLRSPLTGRALQAELRGKIDQMFSSGPNNRFIHEYKSTSKNVDPDSSFWNHLRLDTQTRIYTYAANQLGLGMCGVLYDVWHKPQISPKKLTQAESKAFINSEGETFGQYCGEKFEITTDLTNGPGCGYLLVNGKPPEIEPGAKEGTFAIRETPEMFGARLLQDITTRPEYYFARREIVHNADDIASFEWELFNIYHSIRQMNLHNRWWRNESACEATFRCSYINFCYNNVNIQPGDVPENFRCIHAE